MGYIFFELEVLAFLDPNYHWLKDWLWVDEDEEWEDFLERLMSD